MTGDEHQRVIGLSAVLAQDPLGDHDGRCSEIDTVQMPFGNAVGGDDEQVAGADRNAVRG